jgi:hypothetical protein
LKFGFFDTIDEEPFQVANGEGAILLDSLALLLAGMGASVSQDSWKRKLLPHEGKGLLQLAL